MLSTNNNNSLTRRSRGFSLIELMLAMLLGLIIIGGVMSLYISTRNTQRTSQDQLQLIADARFAINTIAYDLRHAGYWGETDLNRSIVCRLNDPLCTELLPGATDDCAAGWYIDLEKPMIASNDLTNYGSTCTTKSYKANTDVLGVHYADSNSVIEALLATDVTYIRSNYRIGGLFRGTAVPTTSSYEGYYAWKDNAENNKKTKNHRLVSQVYYVSNYTRDPGDGLPSLRRVELQAGPLMKDEVLLPGVEDFQLQFGVDTNGLSGNTEPMNDSANSYVDADKIPPDPITGEILWGRVRTVKIWVLMRAERKDRDGIAGAQTFTLANKAPKTYNDGYRRYLVSSVVKLRNTLEIDVGN